MYTHGHGILDENERNGFAIDDVAHLCAWHGDEQGQGRAEQTTVGAVGQAACTTWKRSWGDAREQGPILRNFSAVETGARGS